ncbi:3'(2'),5'-bisphosphate nucleotidase CysQ [Phenylobacterium immobile]|uniref:3'(2'),5'-bisphosphate nucleotidase CysQ n=1 Tax=Phenylobacterium immobile TaxID=21 RepID=UPI000B28F6EB
MSQADLDLLLDAAREAGELAAALRRKGLEIAYKPGDNTPVTNADLAADALLTERLRTARPEYGWLSEETADDPDRLSRQHLFVVDPVDGTRAFLNDRPWWAVSVAVVDGHRPSAGVVFAPQLEQVYAATAGGGATLNGAAITPSTVRVLEDCAFVADPRMLGHPSWPEPWPEMRVEQRNSTALRICLVAAGAADATLALAAKHDWDLAAADLIASEAGCVVGDHLGRGFRYNGPLPFQPSLLCATPELAPLIRARVRHIAL